MADSIFFAFRGPSERFDGDASSAALREDPHEARVLPCTFA